MTTAPAQRTFGSDTITDGVRVVVEPKYLADRSEPAVGARGGAGKYVFSYRIRITNQSERIVQLISRKWIIVDGDGERGEVNGEGVVGQQPVLGPGQSFEYTSFCPLTTPWGTMEGSYQFEDFGAGAGEPFEVRVGRFFLVSPFAEKQG
jgi:ApaG protein